MRACSDEVAADELDSQRFENHTPRGIGATRDQSEQNARSRNRKSAEIVQQDSERAVTTSGLGSSDLASALPC